MPPPFPISDHCDGHRFFNPGVHINRNLGELLRWRMTSHSERWPRVVEIKPLELPAKPDRDGVACTWINHATTLLRSSTTTWIIDPVFSRCAGPWGREAPPEALAKTGISDSEFSVLDPGQTIYV